LPPTGAETEVMILTNETTRAAMYQAQGAETAEEIIGVLTAISVVSKRPYAAQLQNALAPVHDRQFVQTHQLLAELLLVQAVRGVIPPACIVCQHIDGFFSERFGQIF